MGFLTSMTRMWLTRSARPFRFTDDCDEHLPYEDVEGLGLYIHIPFCRTLCDFCPYCKMLYDEALAHRYIKALKHEIEIVGSDMSSGNLSPAGQGSDASIRRKRVTTLYFGGGTPALCADEIEGIIEIVGHYFEITEGIGLELHPADVTEERLHVLKAAGVTRISIGVQSFSDEYLDVLGRGRQDWDRIFAALAAVPFETVSMDFIFALPGQTIDSVRSDIDRAFSNGANHIAIYPFIDFTFTQRSFSRMVERDKRELLDQIVEYCNACGYVRDLVWTFAKPGTCKYSSMTRDNFLGFGCSATSLLSDCFKVNTFSVADYIDRLDGGRLPSALTLRFTRRQRMVYYLFWSVYTMSVDEVSFESFFGESLEHCYGLELGLLKALGLVRHADGRYVMTARGAYYYHYYENYYTLSYIDQMWNLMRQEAFPETLVIR